MGNGAASVKVAGESYDAPDTNLIKPRGCLQQFLLTKREPVKDTFSQQVKVCGSSWCALVQAKNVDKVDITSTMVGIFCSEVCDRLVTCSPQVYKRLLSSHDARLGGTELVFKRYGLLAKLIQFILSLPDDSIETKQGLRALGRAHLRRNISENDSKILSNAIVETIAAQMGSFFASYTLDAWIFVLEFVVGQMYFDKIIFRSHCSQGLPELVIDKIGSTTVRSEKSSSSKMSHMLSGLAQMFTSKRRNVNLSMSVKDGSRVSSNFEPSSVYSKSMKPMVAFTLLSRSKSYSLKPNNSVRQKSQHTPVGDVRAPIMEYDLDGNNDSLKSGSKTADHNTVTVGSLFRTQSSFTPNSQDDVVQVFEEEDSKVD
jgi:hypothetical protein